jgi:hypothetical protein
MHATWPGFGSEHKRWTGTAVAARATLVCATEVRLGTRAAPVAWAAAAVASEPLATVTAVSSTSPARLSRRARVGEDIEDTFQGEPNVTATLTRLFGRQLAPRVVVLEK